MLAVVLGLLLSGVDLEEQRRGDLVARLSVRIPDEGAGPERGCAWYTLTCTGPLTMQLAPPQLEDALAGWRIARQASSWSSDKQAAHQTLSLMLVQVKSGRLALPGIRVRLRSNPRADWQEVFWPDPLHEARGVLPVEELPALPLSPWPARGRFLALGVASLLLVVLLVRKMERLRVWSGRGEPRWQRALRRVDESRDPGAISDIVRSFVEEQSGLPVSRQITSEWLARLREQPGLSEDLLARLEQFFGKGDLIKFAGQTLSESEQAEFVREARELVHLLATWSGGESRGNSKGR